MESLPAGLTDQAEICQGEEVSRLIGHINQFGEIARMVGYLAADHALKLMPKRREIDF